MLSPVKSLGFPDCFAMPCLLRQCTRGAAYTDMQGRRAMGALCQCSLPVPRTKGEQMHHQWGGDTRRGSEFLRLAFGEIDNPLHLYFSS